MKNEPLVLGIDAQANLVRRGRVSALLDGGSVAVVCDDIDKADCCCDLLQTSESSQLQLTVGDAVVVLLPRREGERGVVLGRVGSARAGGDAIEEAPDELVVEARKNLVLKCGDGSITIRADGKILIKGKDLVSHARRVNRIKGGSVAIN
ncbi:MAG: hypothetical protein JSV86_13625 [Gemmatimonadota bacterium]|nr:MAG: hypothetical protein JSV86_13625 [Gemmatimonadota bacterium]